MDATGSTETARLRSGARSSQSDLTTANGDVAMMSVVDGNVTDRSDGGSSQPNWRRILLLIIAITVHNIPGCQLVFFWTKLSLDDANY